MTTEVIGLQSTYYGLPSDEKPIEGVTNGSVFVEFQEGMGLKVYMFEPVDKVWVDLSGNGNTGGDIFIDAPRDGKHYVRYNGAWKLLPHIPDISELTGANKDLSNLSEEGKNKFLACLYENENLKSIVEHQDYGIARMVGNKNKPEIAINNTNIGQISGETFHEIAVGSTEREDAAGMTIRKDEISMGVSKEYKVSEGSATDSTKKMELLFKPEFDRPLFKVAYSSPTGGGSTFTDDLALVSDLDGKVDIVEGYGLSQENFTPAEKAKLAGLESSHFKGSYLTLAALQAAVPTSEDGGYAYVGDVGEEAVNYIWDIENSAWTLGGKGTNDTPAQVKAKYESNADTNVFTDAEKQKLANLPSTLGGLGATTWTTTFKTSEPYDSMKVYYIEYGTTNAFRSGNTIKYGDSLISTEGKTYFVTTGVDKGSGSNVVFGAQRVEDHEITGKTGAKGEQGEKGEQGLPGKDGVDGANKDLSNLSEIGEGKFVKQTQTVDNTTAFLKYSPQGMTFDVRDNRDDYQIQNYSSLTMNNPHTSMSAYDNVLGKDGRFELSSDHFRFQLTTNSLVPGESKQMILEMRSDEERPRFKNEITGEEGFIALKSDIKEVGTGNSYSENSIWVTNENPDETNMELKYMQIFPAHTYFKKIERGDIILSVTGKFYMSLDSIPETSSSETVCRVQEISDVQIQGEKGEDGKDGKDGLGVGDIQMGEFDTGRKDIFGDKIYRFATVGKTSGTASQQGFLLMKNVKRLWSYGGSFGDATAQTPLGAYLAVSTNNNFPYTAYPHIVGTDLYLYHYLLKDKLDFYIYVEYTKTTP